VFRWLFVTVLIISIAAGVISAIIALAFGAVGFRAVGQIVGTALAAPINVMAAIVLIRLTTLLSNRDQPPPPTPPLPDWMNTPAAQDPAGGPPVASA
jgi:hypothetical protein